MYVGHTETKIDWKLGWRWHVMFSIVLRTGFSEKNPHYCFAFVWWSPLDLQMYFLKADDYVLQGTKSQKSTSKNQEQKDLSNDKHEHKSERDWKKASKRNENIVETHNDDLGMLDNSLVMRNADNQNHKCLQGRQSQQNESYQEWT